MRISRSLLVAVAGPGPPGATPGGATGATGTAGATGGAVPGGYAAGDAGTAELIRTPPGATRLASATLSAPVPVEEVSQPACRFQLICLHPLTQSLHCSHLI